VVFDQALQDTLTARALTNLEPLPAEIAAPYHTYLAEHPDAVMAYLIGAERSANLWNADPRDLLSHYEQILLMLEREEFDYSPEFFLAYIAKITVGNERLTPYRELFARLGLLELQTEYPDLLERIRAVNLWCRERMTFVSTSGRTQDPHSILLKSNIGRCGEMQVLFISACRAVGIPARPAWTPWWAHTDNNHAWTEVFVNGNWYYTGSAEPAYHLNSTWFTGSVNKALLVLARSSFPDSLDDVVSSKNRISYINSTRYYQSTRNVAFAVLDADNRPVAGAKLNIMAYNFSLLRPLLEIETDSCGWARLTISQGAFLAVAHRDSLFDYRLVPYDSTAASAAYTLHLSDRAWPVTDFRLEYPPARGQRREDPEFFAEHRQLATDRYNALIDSIQSRAIPGWAPVGDTAFVQLFESCRNNKQPLLDLVWAHPDLPADFWRKAHLIDEKFHWQTTMSQWELLLNAYRNLVEEELSEELGGNLLEPGVYYEQLPRVAVPATYITGRGLPTAERTAMVLMEVHARHRVDEDKAPLGLLALESLLAAPLLQDYQFKTLCCYVLKANRIPAAYTRIPATVMVWADSAWRNYDVVKNEFARSAETADRVEEAATGALIPIEFTLRDTAGQPVTLNPDNIAVTLFQEGRFYYNDRQLEYDQPTSRLTGELEPGDYQLQLGLRESGEVTQVKLTPLQLHSGDSVRDTLVFRDFKRSWRKAPADYLAFLTGWGGDAEGDLVLLLGNYDDEPVQRLADRVRNRLGERRFVWVGTTPAPVEVAPYRVDAGYARFLTDNPELKHRLITFYYDRETETWFQFEGIWDLLYE